MRRSVVLAFALLALSHVSVHAQTLPFDMTPDRPADSPVSNTPAVTVPADGAGAGDTPATGVTDTQADPSATAAEPFHRFILPNGNLGLTGEFDDRTWSVYLTPQQAAIGSKLNIGYQNSIFVAPEVSRLSLEVNNARMADEPVRSPDSVSDLSFDIPKGLLKPGANLIRLRANQRHRTDCTVQSTYELWSNIDAQRTYLSFADNSAQALQSSDDIRAIGVDENGLTRFNFIVPALEQPGATIPLMRLSQGLALLANMPNQAFSFETQGLPAPKAGEMTVLVGTPAEIQPLLSTVPLGAASAPVAGFVTDPNTGSPILVLSGPTWQAIQTAIESIVASTDVDVTTRRELLATQNWRSPDAPFLFADTRLSFAQLGLKTEQFSGRRFRTNFTVGIPSDFYADAYGTALILLDAAYSEAVLPGSHVDIYVNGSIASTVPITSSGGGILRHLPINVTMRHFRPGVNTIAIEALIETEDDKVCAPGATGVETPRFALFDTSEFHMPDFARIGQLPNLAALSGTGFPYNRSQEAIPLSIDRVDADTLSAAATVLGRMAVGAGHPIPVETIASPALIGNRSAIFIGSLSQMPQMVFTRMNIAETARNTWGPDPGDEPEGVDTEATFDEWRQKLRGGIWSGQISSFEDWVKRNFDISLSSLRFAPTTESSFTPSNEASLLIAQGASPDGTGTWSVVAAPSGRDLREGVEAVSTLANWSQLAGHITTYRRGTKTVETVPVNAFNFMPTQPASVSNYRLIAANWLSTNILSYAMLLSALGVLLGLATAALLTNLGRRK
ncbi:MULTISPECIES: cellulose biosynthesis cyclic di-GMP-binding regulatory protein BcsB [unclassified Rhizobium]|uniref:cellulose biosynthesis cyclic di-GMP-binding regulatory protein BcsB n=1 Tax=unclassified Rhizobium TaxID=2613769 RepID=UPI0007135FF7|nr:MULTISPECIES: cellulose biosynthesis cyclic di-GMP-binding regulatory protein BcsB [unclassified Rhizobium]KQS88111.1 cellulose synthase BcsB subunit [Rhizobium sp. Leaf391]KQT00608.1 cellulose synthase BcsB subunit [Rhizobium sp. Leaf386]KQU09080.1 cellulose synthase BcsB subunit [Rhizobium sp. Leaf453]